MKVVFNNVGKHFNHEWFFKNVNYTFETSKSYAILGANGTGKSTLAQILSGYLSPSEGSLNYTQSNTEIDKDDIYKHITFEAPYIELIEDYTLKELINFQENFKPYFDKLDCDSIIEILNFKAHQNKYVSQFSSGMKQRLKLALAILADTEILLLDEPCTNLDEEGVKWYQGLISKYKKERLVIVSSNSKAEYDFCEEQLNIGDFK